MSEPVKRGRGRPKGSLNKKSTNGAGVSPSQGPSEPPARSRDQVAGPGTADMAGAGKTLSAESIPAPGMARGVIARCGNGYLGLVTAGPTRIVVAGEVKQLWTGLHLTDDRSRKIGDHWASFAPVLIGRLEDLLP